MTLHLKKTFGLLLGLGLVAAALGAGSPSDLPGFQAAQAKVNGTRIAYRIAGEGSPVLLIHGYTQTGRSWRPLATELAKRHRVIVPDLRGIGGSALEASGYDKKTAAADLRALVQSLGLGPVAVVGHDIGLMVAYAYAAQWPEEVSRLVVMDAPLPGIGPWESVWTSPVLWHFHFYGETAEALVKGRERIYFEKFWNGFAVNPKAVQEADRKAYAQAYAQPGRMKAGFTYFATFSQDAADNRIFAQRKLTMPVLTLAGERSAGALMGLQFKEVATQVENRVVKNAGHWLLEEQPAEVQAAIQGFLAAGAAPAN